MTSTRGEARAHPSVGDPVALIRHPECPPGRKVPNGTTSREITFNW
jgi:hypothetical protein